MQLVCDCPSSELVFTVGSKIDEGVTVAAVSTKHNIICKHTLAGFLVTKVELRAILLAPRHVYHSQEKSFLMLPDSPSSLQAISNMKYDHPILGKILELHMELIRDRKKTVFGHVGIRANSAADSAAKDVLDGDISDELIAFSGLKISITK